MSNFTAGEWPVSYQGSGCSAFDDVTEEAQAEFEAYAAELLWNWTDRVFGTYTEAIRPVRIVTPYRPSTFEGMGPAAAYYNLGNQAGHGYLPYLSSTGDWFNLRCGRCSSVACQCSPDSAKALHLQGPVIAIVEILIDGVVLDPAAYRVDNGHTLIRQDGEVWPTAQDLIEKTTEVGTWSIEYEHGVSVPGAGQLAAGLLACELYKSFTADPTCGLPSRVKTVSRQGVTVGIFDTFEGLDEGRTGLWAIDSWISSVTRPRDYVGVVSPDTVRRTAWGVGT